MTTTRRTPLPIYGLLLFALGWTTLASAAPTVYTDRAAWEAQIGGCLRVDDFEADTCGFAALPSPYTSTAGTVMATVGVSPAFQLLCAGLVNGSKAPHFRVFPPGMMQVTPAGSMNAFGFDYRASEAWSVTANGVTTPLSISTPAFIGYIDTSPIALFELKSTSLAQGGTSIDNLSVATAKVAPGCTSFDNGSLAGWAGCPFAPNVSVTLASPGPSGAGTDLYLLAGDQANASLLCAGPGLNGCWTGLAEGGCMNLCYDFKVVVDGCPANCGSTNEQPACPNNCISTFTPSVFLYSGTTVARFTPNFTITENDNWRRICAPIGLLHDNQLPSNAFGSWSMVGPATNADWNALLSNVTNVGFPLEMTSFQTERIGIDNVCLVNDPACLACRAEPANCATWRKTCKKPDTKPLTVAANCVNDTATFMAVNNPTHMCSFLQLVPPSDRCEQALAQFMALLLNKCTGRVTQHCCFASCCSLSKSVKEVIAEIDALLANGGRTEADCTQALTLALAVNNGTGLCDCSEPKKIDPFDPKDQVEKLP